MDPELYVFPKINSAALKIAASTGVFAVVVAAARLLLPNQGLWSAIDENLAGWLSLCLGYNLFIYASYQAWLATREKNSVEDPKRLIPLRLLDTGSFARVRHPMYGMFILANAGLGLAANSVYGLGFSLLSLVAFVLNGIFEERASLLPLFGNQYREYMERVPARCFTVIQAILLTLVIFLMVAGVILRSG